MTNPLEKSEMEQVRDRQRRESSLGTILKNSIDQVEAMQMEEMRLALRDLADYASMNYCCHDDTHRGGVIWEICDQCGAKWADDEGGKPTDAGKLPDVIARAYRLSKP